MRKVLLQTTTTGTMRGTLFAAAVAACGAQLVLDTPYAEIMALRRPFASIWSAEKLPTGWLAIPAPTVSRIFGATVTAVNGAATPVVLGEAGGSLIDFADGDATYSVTGAAEPVDATWQWAPVPAGTLGAGIGFLAVSAQHVYTGACTRATTVCALSPVATHTTGAPTSTPLLYNATAPGGMYFWISGASGTAAYSVSAAGAFTPVWAAPASYAAVAYSAANGELAMGNETAVLYYTPTPPFAFQYFDWVTDLATDSGAPIDDAVTALVYAPAPATATTAAGARDMLIVANPTCLNIRTGDNLWLRLGGLQGLPYSNLDARRGPARTTPRVWIGSDAGAMLLDTEAPAGQGVSTGARRTAGAGSGRAMRAASATAHGVEGGRSRRMRHGRRGHHEQAPAANDHAATAAAATATAAPMVIPLQQQWRYFYGPRYFPSTPTVTFTGRVVNGGIVALGNTTYVLTTTGLTVFTTVSTTLAEKAAAMEAVLPRHDRLGMVAECDYASFGVTSPCTTGPSPNNGLWTSVVVNAMAFKYAVTKDPAARDAAWHFFTGMQLLNNVTGITGLIARSAVAPGTPFPGTDWHNSTSMPGFAWYGTASSDEVVGHLFAYPVMATLGVDPGNTTALAAVQRLLIDLAVYIVSNNFTLVDITGEPTQWGHWDPATINGNRMWSDDRGINSLEIIALTTSAMSFLTPGSPQYTLLQTGRDSLITANGYLRNMLTVRINSPCDINYSDDELEWFSYFPLLYTLQAGGNNGTGDNLGIGAATAASILRSWATGVNAERASIYGAMVLAMSSTAFPGPMAATGVAAAAAAAAAVDAATGASGAVGASPIDAEAVLNDIVWNLRTWGVELTDWPAQNSHRLDIMLNPELDRFGQSDGLRVLPQNERYQGRWNADPFSLDDGSGMQEDDPGAWLLPYWLARYYGILG